MLDATGNSWNEARETRLRELYAEGRSCSLIAAALNEETGAVFTRNAVIGKISRLGFERRGMGKQPPIAVQRPRAEPRKPRARRPNVLRWGGSTVEQPPQSVELPVVALPPLNVPLLDISASQCRWICSEGPVLFCGHPTIRDGSWCLAHRRLVFTPRTEGRGSC